MYIDQTQGKKPLSSDGKEPEGVPDTCLWEEARLASPTPNQAHRQFSPFNKGLASQCLWFMTQHRKLNPLQTPTCVQLLPSHPWRCDKPGQGPGSALGGGLP